MRQWLMAWLTTLVALAAVAPATTAWAKRVGPRPVAPVVLAGVRYSAPNDSGRAGTVEAHNADTGEKLWDAVIYSVKIDPLLEEDVQWVFITDLAVGGDGGTLLVTNEKGERYALDLKTRAAKRLETDGGRQH